MSSRTSVQAAGRINVLSIDGGSIRGIIPARILQQIEQQIGRHLWEVFDLVAGTSTGGIIALGLGTSSNNGRPYRPSELLQLYMLKVGRGSAMRGIGLPR